MFYKVVAGLMPAIASEDYLKETRNKRKRKAKQYEGFEISNIIDRQTVNNSPSNSSNLRQRSGKIHSFQRL